MTLLQEQISNLPMWTDKAQALAAIAGIPSVIIGIFLLFRKDKDKAAQINALKDIAKSQNNVVEELKHQVEQLTYQTSEFEFQSSLMFKQNELFEKSIDVQISALLQSKEFEELKVEREKQKRLLEIQPYISRGSIAYNINNIELYFRNKGAKAKNITLVIPETSAIKFQQFNLTALENLQTFSISGCLTEDYKNSNVLHVSFQGYFEFMDIENNKYRQYFKGINNGRFSINDPMLID